MTKDSRGRVGAAMSSGTVCGSSGCHSSPPAPQFAEVSGAEQAESCRPSQIHAALRLHQPVYSVILGDKRVFPRVDIYTSRMLKFTFLSSFLVFAFLSAEAHAKATFQVESSKACNMIEAMLESDDELDSVVTKIVSRGSSEDEVKEQIDNLAEDLGFIARGEEWTERATFDSKFFDYIPRGYSESFLYNIGILHEPKENLVSVCVIHNGPFNKMLNKMIDIK